MAPVAPQGQQFLILCKNVLGCAGSHLIGGVAGGPTRGTSVRGLLLRTWAALARCDVEFEGIVRYRGARVAQEGRWAFPTRYRGKRPGRVRGALGCPPPSPPLRQQPPIARCRLAARSPPAASAVLQLPRASPRALLAARPSASVCLPRPQQPRQQPSGRPRWAGPNPSACRRTAMRRGQALWR